MKDLGTVLAALIPLAVAIHWIVALLKDATNKNVNGVITRAVAFIAAMIVVSLYAHSTLDIGGSLAYVSTLPWQGLAFASLFIAAGGGTLADVLSTFNRADPTVAQKLLPKE